MASSTSAWTRRPIEMVEVAAMAFAGREAANRPEIGACFEWRALVDTFRTLVVATLAGVRATFEGLGLGTLPSIP